jgi:tRNA1(Val) A37 N6-methylase TrmN6
MVLEMGSGNGRVASNVFVESGKCKEIALVEPVKHLLDASRENLKA